MKLLTHIFALVGLVITVMTSPVQATIELRFTPADTTIGPNSPGRVAVFMDQEIDLRTIEMTVTYDTTIITSEGGGPGTLFTDSGFFLWSDFDDEVPGQWTGYTVIMGAGDYISGPGELYAWDVMAQAEGTSAVTSVAVRLFGPDGNLIAEDVNLPPTTITVGQVVAAYPQKSPFPGELQAVPNPFNPRTNIQFDLPEATPVLLAVYDARGRQIAVLMDRLVEAGNFTVAWDGKNSAGSPQPGGVYFFFMKTTLGTALTKAVLLK